MKTLKYTLKWLAVGLILAMAAAACYRQGHIDGQDAMRRRLEEMLDGLRMKPWDEIAPKENPR